MILVDVEGKEKAVTLVDLADWEKIKHLRWYESRGYALADVGEGRVRLHRYLLDAPSTHEVDHLNGNGLDNRRSNLRLVLHAENSQNLATSQASSTGVRNVQRITKGRYAGMFRVIVMREGKQHYGGHFPSVEDAREVAIKLREELFTHHNEDREK